MDKTNSCFVIMPFSDTEHGSEDHKRKITGAQWSHIYEHWIKKAVESFRPEKIICKRSPAKPGNFVKGIVADLDSSILVIAEECLTKFQSSGMLFMQTRNNPDWRNIN